MQETFNIQFWAKNISKFSYYHSDFQTPATAIAEGLIHFHHDLMVFLVFICFFVLWLLIRTLSLHAYSGKGLVLTRNAYSFNYYKHQSSTLEIVWTIIPAIILMIIAVPSFALLYSTSSLVDPELTVKIIGHQWYWSYEINDNPNLIQEVNFDSYMVKVESSEITQIPRNLIVDNVLILPTLTYIRLLITADDVLHCWTVPAFGLKVDACPGRLNASTLLIQRPGIFFGACSEICGVNHAFMPIGVRAIDAMSWVSALQKTI